MNPIVLLYNIPTQKEKMIRALCQKLSAEVICVDKKRHGCTVGQVLRGEGNDCGAKKPFDEEMLVMQLPGILLDFFLQGLMREGADVALKAAITPTNVSWTADALYRELVRERQEFLKAGMKK